jgi:hypothetical protein
MTDCKAYMREYMRRRRASKSQEGESKGVDAYQFRCEDFQVLCDFLEAHSRGREPVKLTVRLGWARIEAKKGVFY